MGIVGLLPFVEKACEERFISNFAGKKIAVDVSTFIYKGLYHTDYKAYLMNYVDMFAKNDIEANFVFDGQAPQEKAFVKQKRDEAREKRALSTNSTPMVITEEIIADVKRSISLYPHVKIIQAPGEADPQLAYMERNGLVDAIVTEDTDLIVYGCESIIFKLLPYGKCVHYRRSRFSLPLDFAVFRWACIMAGCDYLPGGLYGYGLKKAVTLLKDTFKPRPPYDKCELKRILTLTKSSDDFIEQFMRADEIYQHAHVLNTVSGEIVELEDKRNVYFVHDPFDDVECTFDFEEYKKANPIKK